MLEHEERDTSNDRLPLVSKDISDVDGSAVVEPPSSHVSLDVSASQKLELCSLYKHSSTESMTTNTGPHAASTAFA